jgi:tRNA pseudouridine55 synthase
MISGVLVLDKPEGITSHDVVDRARRALGTRKVGHLGTLDPAATGVLPLVVGPATRLARYLPSSPKVYEGTILLGEETTTDDATGEVRDTRPVRVTRDQVLEAMSGLTGRVLQTPPAFSAKKLGGVRAYKLARTGRPARPQPVEVTVEEFTLVEFGTPRIGFHVSCSAGTYIRSLARDLGRRLGTGGHLASLRRIRAGPFRIEDACPLDRIGECAILRPEALLSGFPSLVLEAEDAGRIGNGQSVRCGEDAEDLCIFNKKGELIAMGRAEKGWARPQVVLI